MATDTSIQQQVVREAPEIEALKIDLMKQAQALATQQGFANQIPGYQVAGFSPAQIAAMRAAEQQGVGAFMPYVSAANQGLAGAMGTTREAGDVLRGADTRNQFYDAQAAMRQAGAAAAGISGGIGQINTGLGYMDLAGQRSLAADTTGRFGGAYQDIGTGINALATAQNMAARSSQADLMPATAAIGQGLRGTSDAQRMAMLAAGADYAGSQGLLAYALQNLRAPSAVAAQQVAADDITAAQTGYRPGLEFFQRGAVRDVSGREIRAPQMAAAQTGFAPTLSAFQMEAAPAIRAGSITGGDVLGRYMSPYIQGVVDIQTREAARADEIASQARAAQAVRTGAFGGEREGVVRAEAARNLSQLQADIRARGLQEAYQQAQQQFNVEQQASLAAQQANQQAGLTVGQQNLASALGVQQLGAQTGLQVSLANLNAQQQANVQNQAAALQAQGMSAEQAMQAALANQQAELAIGQQNLAARLGVQELRTQTELQAALANLNAEQQARVTNAANRLQASGMNQQAALQAALANQQAEVGFNQLQAQTGLQGAQLLGQQAAQQAQLGQSAAGLYGNLSQQQIAAGQGLGQLGFEQARLGQSAANTYQQAAQGYGNLASQQGALAGQESNIQQNIANLLMQQGAGRTNAAQALAGIYGQQSGMFQNIGQGIGSLAGQQFGIGQGIAQGLGQIGQQYGQQALQQLGIGQAAQGMQQSDINFLYNVGQAQQAFRQQQADAERATQMQRLYAPYQQLGFLSDIYRGAPSTQMATTAVSQPSASPFQQAAGIGLAGLTAAAGAAKANLF